MPVHWKAVAEEWLGKYGAVAAERNELLRRVAELESCVMVTMMRPTRANPIDHRHCPFCGHGEKTFVDIPGDPALVVSCNKCGLLRARPLHRKPPSDQGVDSSGPR
jgi:hypothetical protein